MRPNEPIIEAEGLVKRFGPIQAVDGVSFEVYPAEIFGFLGPNGAGKTTTISILCTLLRPTAGVARINGYDVVKQPNEVRRSIGLVFQDPSLDDVLTAWENLNFHASVYNIPRSLAHRRMEEMLRLVELWERRHDQVKTFSGGMKRRLEIARGLLHSPRVLFLDEPTPGLDPQTRHRLWEYILHLRDQEGVSIFLTTHYMDEASNADRIAIIDQGRIIALDTPENLKSLVGGDVITLRTENDEGAIGELKERFGLEARLSPEGIMVEVPQGDVFVPRLVSNLPIPITSLSLRRPTLDDVFLKLTGRQIRDESADFGAQARAMMSQRGGFHGPRR